MTAVFRRWPAHHPHPRAPVTVHVDADRKPELSPLAVKAINDGLLSAWTLGWSAV